MKKIFALALVLMLALCAAGAYAATGDALLGRTEEGDQENYYTGIFAEGDTLYLTTYEGLSTYHIGDADAVMYTYNHDYSGNTEDVNYDYRITSFGCDGKLYGIRLTNCYRNENGEGHTEFGGAQLGELTMNEADNTVDFSPLFDLDWEDMLERYDSEVYARDPQSCVAFGGTAFLLVYNENYDYMIKTVDLETGEMRDLDDLRDIFLIAPYKDNTLLVEQYNYARPNEVTFVAYDPASDSVNPVAVIEVAEYQQFNCVAYDADADQVYCVQGGEICPLDLQTGELGQGVADAPMEAYGGSRACVMNGYFCYASSGACVRNLDPEQRAEVRLKVFDGGYSESVSKAQYLFSNAHGDVSLAISRDYNEQQHIVENMMNRDDSVDIYIIGTSSEPYSAVYNRGYMLELDASEKLAALGDSLYPSLKEALSRNGRLVAMPVQAFSWGLGVNEKALERIGMKLEDVPDNWMDLLDFINELPDRMPEDAKVTLFYQEMTFEDARNELFYQIFNDYQRYVNATDPGIGYDTELLRTLLQKLEQIDFTRFGYAHQSPEEEDDEPGPSGGMVVMDGGFSDSDSVLSLFETSVGCTFGNFYGQMIPVLMSMDANSPHYMVLDLNVAFVNPFSKHPDVALQFLEQLADCMDDSTRYTVDPSMNEPIKSRYYDEQKKDMEDYIASLKENLANAEEVDKQAMEEELRYIEDYYANDFERFAWEISQEQIDWFRANAKDIVPASVNWLYSDGAGEASDLIWQYTGGQIDARTMLAGIDKKVKMMMMEGN